MKNLDEESYLALTANAHLIEEDIYGPKVLRMNDGRICKIFRCKRSFSSAKYYPYAQRFADNAETLISKGIPCVVGCEVYRVPHLERDIVIYNFLEGQTLRDRLADKYESSLIESTAAFISKLHKLGVYFRSLHFGNILILPSGEFGLIDISDMKIKSKSVGPAKRVRNFKAFMRYKTDMAHITTFGFKEFLDIYLKSSGMSLRKFRLMLKFQPKHPAVGLLED